MACVICAESSIISTRDLTHNESITKFMEQLTVYDEGIPEVILCEYCLSAVEKATEWREQVGEVERDVRSLQRIILKMMRHLKSLQGSYLEEMKKLDDKIRESNFARRDNDAGYSFRQGILNAVLELRVFPESAANVDSNSLTQIRLENENTIKTEDESMHPVARKEEECLSVDQDPLSIDIEHVNYSVDVAKIEALPQNEISPPSVAMTSISTRRKTTIKNKARNNSNRRGFFPCTFCEKRFPSNHHLQLHVYTHTGERPFKCTQCPMAFKKKEHLTRHLMNHTGTKPFICAVCKKEFARKDRLQEHEKTHTRDSNLVIGI